MMRLPSVFVAVGAGLSRTWAMRPETRLETAEVEDDLSPCIGEVDPEQQLNGDILKAICSKIRQEGANFLVFGLGRDSSFWYNNVKGKVLFLENHPDWLDFQSEGVRSATHLVSYTTVIEEYENTLKDQNKLDEFYATLPEEVLNTHWDAILVDSPMGMENAPGVPGRMQSVNAALKLAKEGTAVFVDDWQRKVERHSADALLHPHSSHRAVYDNGHGGLTAMYTMNPPARVAQAALVQKEDLSPCVGQIDPEQQLNGDILKAICKKIRQEGANFLVFGLGRDSAFWYNNVKGKVLFLENHPDWLDFQSEGVRSATHLVSYTSVIEEYESILKDQKKLDEFYATLPEDVLNTHWDAILVDSPMGMDNAPGVPGRMQSVNAALKLAKEGTAVFVDDWQRRVERKSADTLLHNHASHRAVYDNGHGGLTAMYTMKAPAGVAQAALVQKSDLSPCVGQIDPEQQLNGDILKAICKKIRQEGANFLVFGLGRDSAFWYNNVKGKVLFLENHPDWLDFQSEGVRSATHLVSYTSVIEEYESTLKDQKKLDEFYATLPEDVLNTHWDAILVDSPMGMDNAPGVPGRMQSVNAALKLAKRGTAVFVDDWQRKVERKSADTLLHDHASHRDVYDNGHGGLTAMYTMK